MRRADVMRIAQRATKAVASSSAEIMASMALIGGWILVTLAVAEYAPTRVTWLASAGLFLLSCFGWGPLLVLARFGLYSATRDEKKGRTHA